MKPYFANLSAPALHVKHAELERVDGSPFRSKCPKCRGGRLLVYRHRDPPFALRPDDRCIVCGQLVIYDDLEIGGERVEPHSTLRFFKVANRKPVPCTGREWTAWFETSEDARRVARTDVAPGVDVRTDFFGMTTPLREEPTMFQTMVFGGPLDGDFAYAETWEEAERVHAKWVERARAAAAAAAEGKVT